MRTANGGTLNPVWTGLLIAIMLVAVVSLTYGLIRAATTQSGDAPWWGPRWAVLAAIVGGAAVVAAAMFAASL